MLKLLIRVLNIGWLFVALFGVPAVASRSWGNLRLSSNADLDRLALLALGLGVALNLAAALFLARDRQTRRTCWHWVGMHAALLGLHLLEMNRVIGFGWLRDLVLWLRGILGG